MRGQLFQPNGAAFQMAQRYQAADVRVAGDAFCEKQQRNGCSAALQGGILCA